MRFFIPERLVRFEYLSGKEEPPHGKKEAEEERRYGNLKDFAFFAANFGYSKRDYLELTPAEKRFLAKAYEDRLVADSNLLAAAVGNAVANVLRKKGKRPRKLWHKRTGRGDVKERLAAMQAVKKIEKKEDRRWVALVYAANGMRQKKKE